MWSCYGSLSTPFYNFGYFVLLKATSLREKAMLRMQVEKKGASVNLQLKGRTSREAKQSLVAPVKPQSILAVQLTSWYLWEV